MKQKLLIEISGDPGSGKSMIASAITNMLDERDLTYRLEDDRGITVSAGVGVSNPVDVVIKTIQTRFGVKYTQLPEEPEDK